MRLDGIGDALVCAPLIVALRDAGHAIGIALSDRNCGTYAPGVFSAEHVLERIPWPKHGSRVESRKIADHQIAAAHYDTALIVSEEPEAYELARGIPRRVGFVTRWAKPLKTVWARTHLTRALHRQVVGGRAHEVEVVFGLAGEIMPVGTQPTRDPTRLRPLLLDRVHAVRAVRSGRRVVVQLGAKWSRIGVDPAALRALIDAFAAHGARFVVSAAERAEAVACDPSSLEVCADMMTWKTAIASADVVVTPDTGAAHLAGMIGIPVVDIFPDADASAQIARWHPWAAPFAAFTVSEVCTRDGLARMRRAADEL